MRKTYVLDTSTLIYDPGAYKHFAHSDVVIPIAVLNELDKLKKLATEAGKNARVAIRLLDEISNLGDISLGIILDDDIILKVDTNWIDLSGSAFRGMGDPSYGDTQILACAQSLWHLHPTHDVVMVSNDINLRVKAKSRGIEAEAHEGEKYSLSDLYSGVRVITNEDAGLALQQDGKIDPRCFGISDLSPHECVLFEADNGDGISMGRKVSRDCVKLVRKNYPWNIAPRNKEQIFAIDLLMDKSIDLITMIGKAGTGKSLMVLATALELVIGRKEYDKFIIYRPIQPVGNDIGYLPGTMEEKLAPWFQAVMDNFEMLLTPKGGGAGGGNHWRRELEERQKRGQIEMEAITYIIGRSIPNAIILVDECQNLSKEDVKTILTRAGENTKIILTGDIEQIDNSLLDATSNGLTHVIEKFKDSELAGHVTFTQGERSRLASKAAEIL
jgi:PhoH-like ATPase